MVLFQTMLKIKWTESITNEEISNRAIEKRELFYISIKIRRDSMIGHILRHDTLKIIEREKLLG